MESREHFVGQTMAEGRAEAKPQGEVSARSAGSKPRILALEHESLLEIYRLLFEDAGYDLVATSDEHEALHLLLTQRIALFIQNLAGHVWLLRLLKSQPSLCDIPVLVVSGFSKSAAIDRLREVGLKLYRDLDGYLEKPFNPEDLFALIEIILVRRGAKSDP